MTSVYDYGEHTDAAGRPVSYVVMELLPGETLARRLASGPLPPTVAMRTCAQVAEALAAAHERSLVHRDIKPSNVMLTPAGVKVVDFGIATTAGRPELEADGRLLGTAAYLAPERLAGGTVLPASDVYALGLLLYRTLTNELPWSAETPRRC
ncbi:serine/threonine-protein kinase [Micromonospora sp. M12]